MSTRYTKKIIIENESRGYRDISYLALLSVKTFSCPKCRCLAQSCNIHKKKNKETKSFIALEDKTKVINKDSLSKNEQLNQYRSLTVHILIHIL